MTSYRVTTDALRGNVNALHNAADAYHGAADRLDGQTLRDDDVGFLAAQAGVSSAYNNALEEMRGTLLTSGNMLVGGAADLGRVAATYDEADAEYYRRFGYEIEVP